MSISKETRVGAFVLAGLVIAGIVVFLVGDERRMFAKKISYDTSFSDVQGLKVGAPVRLGGIDIGNVASVGHGENATDVRLYVHLHIVDSEAARIRKDTIAHVANKGLLGDKMIELTGGSASQPPIPPGGTIQGEDPSDFMNLFSQVGTMTRRADEILTNLEATSKSLANVQLHEDLQKSAHSMSLILNQVAEGNGYAHRIISDPAEADRLSRVVTELERAATEMKGTFAETREMVTHVNRGPGFAHDVVYGEQGTDTLGKFGEAAGELAATMRGVREGNGLAHSLLFGGDAASQKLSENVDAISTDIRRIVADVRAGKGTIGALLVNPSIYEDMKSVLGNVQRNDALRALVRYSIKQDEKQPELRVRGPAAPAGAAVQAEPAPPR